MISSWSSLLVVIVLALRLAESRGPPHQPFSVPSNLVLAPSQTQHGNASHAASVHYFDQVLDHFDPLSSAIFQQRYFINDEFWDRSGRSGPVFLLLGGEGALSLHHVTRGHHIELARAHSALVIALEHRYYGKSIPNLPNMSVANLRYLTSMNALEDVAMFLDHIRPVLEISADSPVIVFGGSYPGALAAWFRMKFPSQVYGAVASSAPVRARVNFHGYMEGVGHDYGNEGIGGSHHCQTRIRKAFRDIETVGDGPEGMTRLTKLFRSCTALNGPKDFSLLLQSLALVFEGAAQFNGQTPLNVRKICSMFDWHTESALAHLVDVMSATIDALGLTCYSYSWSDTIKSLSNVTWDESSSDRQWTFQFCTQFGFYQGCDEQNGCLFSSRIDLDFYSSLCYELFGISKEKTMEVVRATNTEYGGYLSNAERILYVNGDIDPWHVLSVTKDQPDTNQTAIFIEGASHCQDMKASKASDPPPLRQARKQIGRIVERWVTQAAGAQPASIQ